jgi:O-antigen/teichoic acid export membrane protein
MSNTDQTDSIVENLDFLGSSLTQRTVRGGAIVFAVQIIQQLCRLGILAVLARLLTPHDYGLFGMVFAFIVFLNIFLDLGLSMATVQKADLSLAQISILFWANLALGLLLTGVMAACSSIIAWFYQEPDLIYVTLWISLGFAVGAIGIQHRALLMRRMQFGRLAISELGGLITGGAVGIWMALNGYGVYALVGQSLAAGGMGSLCNWILAGWIPGLPVRGSGVREMIKFGGYLTGFNFLNYFARNMDKILLGRFWGATEVGLYTRSYALMLFPINIISDPMGRVIIPALSRLQKDMPRYAQAHLRAMRLLALLSFPVAGGLAVLAEEAIEIVYGVQWMDAVPIFRILCIAGIFQAWANSMGWLYISSGKARKMFLWGSIASPMIVIGILPCIWFGGIGAAGGYTIMTLALVIPLGFWYVTRSVGVPLRPLVKAAVGPLIATGLMCAVVILLKVFVTDSLSIFPKLLILIPGGIAAFIIGILIFGRRVLNEAILTLKAFLIGASLEQ